MSFAETGTKRLGSGQAPSEDYLGAFVRHLRSDGLSDGQICHLRRQARHFMLWLDKHRIPIGEVDHGVLSRFRRHDCRCPGMEGQRRRMLEADSRRFMTGALRLVRFLEDEGRIGHPGELEDNLEHLDAFLDRCAAQGYGSVRLNTFRGSCRHILIWLHQSRIAIRNVDDGTLNRFLDHDCVCPGSFEAPRPRSSHRPHGMCIPSQCSFGTWPRAALYRAQSSHHASPQTRRLIGSEHGFDSTAVSERGRCTTTLNWLVR